MIYINSLREGIQIGIFNLNLYGLVYFFAFLSIFIVSKSYFSKYKKEELAYTLTSYLIIGTLLGARISHFIFYDFSSLISNPLEFFYLWNGGLSFHGGLIGFILAFHLFSINYKNELKHYPLELADTFALYTLVFIILGRIANLLDAEIIGTLSSLPWCIQYENISGCRHPVQLYEALMHLIVFITLYFNQHSLKKKTGLTTILFITLYGTTRFIADFFREYSSLIFNLGIGQYLSLIAIIVGIYFLWKNR